MKKLPAIMLLAILLVNAAGFYVYYIIELQRIHVASRSLLLTMPDQDLTRLSLTIKAYQESFVEEGEVKVNGKMYDIARTNVTRDSVIVYALHDAREDDLLLFVNDIISKPFSADGDVTNCLVNYLSLIYLPVDSFFANTDLRAWIIEHQSAYQIQTLWSFTDQPFQPPRFLAVLR